MILLAVTDPLAAFYSDLADACSKCSDALMIIAFTLAFAGLLMQAYKGMMSGDLSGIMRHIIMTGLVASIIPYYAEWFLAGQTAMGDDLLKALGVDPVSMLESFGSSFGDGPFEGGDAPNIILDIIDPMAWFDYFCGIIGAFIMAIMAIVMYVFFWVGFQIQIIAIYLGSACAPIFMAMLLFEPTRDTAVKYHIGMVGLLFWPLGWGLGMLFANGVMTKGVELVAIILGPMTFVPIVNSVVEDFAIIVIVLIVIVWMLVTLFVAPKIIQKAVTTGAQIGMGLVSAGISTGASVASAGIQAASGAAQMAGGAAITVASGGAAAPIGLGMMGSGASGMGSAAKGLIPKGGD